MSDGNTLKESELKPEYADTGMFKPGVSYHITIIKEAREILMKAAGPKLTKYLVLG